MDPEEQQTAPASEGGLPPASPGLVAPEGRRVYRVLDTATGEMVGMRGGPELEEGLRSGRFGLSGENPAIGVVDDEGNAYDVEPAALREWLAEGRFRLETGEEAAIDEARREAEAHPTLSTARAFAGEAADWASAGLLSAAMTPEGRAAQQLDVERNPIAAALGATAGVLVPAVLTGGASLEGSGVRALARLTPGGFSAAAGTAVERALVARFGQGGVSRALATVGGAVTDGAISGAAAAVTRANIEGTPLEAEQVLSDTLFGAALGLGGGAVIAGGGAALRGASRAVRSVTGGGTERAADYARRLVERGLGQVPEPLVGRAERIAAWASGVDAGDLALFRRNPRRALDADGFAMAARETAESVGALRRQLDEAGAALADAGRRRTALAQAAEGVDAASATTARTTARTALEATQARVRQAVVAMGGDGRTASARVLRGLSDDVDRAVRTVGDDARVALDDLSLDDAVVGAQLAGQSGDAAAGVARAASTAEAIGELDRVIAAIDDAARAAPEVRPVLDEMRAALAQVAGDATVFGRAGATFGELDGARRALLEASEALPVDGRRMAELAQAGGEEAAGLARRLEDAEQLLATAERSGVDVAPARAALEGARRQVADALEWGSVRAATERALAVEGGHDVRGAIMHALGRRVAHGVAGGAIGALLGGEHGAVAGAGMGALFGAMMRPVSAYRRLAHLGDAVRSFAPRLETGLGRLEQALTSGRLGSARPGAGSAASSVRTASRVVVALRGAPEERREEYRRVTAELRELATDPEALGARLGETLAPVGEASPQLADAMTMTAVRGVTHLVEHLPAVEQPTLLSHLPGGVLEPSQWEIDRFLRRYEAVEDPLSILDRAAEGALHVEHREAVEATYPEVYAEIQARVAELLGGLEERPSYQARLQLGVLMGAPADRSLEPSMITALQSHYAQTPQQFESVHGPTQAAPGRLDSSASESTLPRSEQIARRL